MNCRRKWNICTGHLGDAWAPHTACNDNVLGFNATLVGHNCSYLAVFCFNVKHFGVREHLQVAGLQCTFAHQCSGLQRVNNGNAWRVKTAEQNLFVNERNEFFDLGWCEQLGVDAPCLCRRHAAVEFLHALWRTSNFNSTRGVVHAVLDVLLL